MHNPILIEFSFNHHNFSINKPADKDINYVTLAHHNGSLTISDHKSNRHFFCFLCHSLVALKHIPIINIDYTSNAHRPLLNPLGGILK